jgi:rhamnogalacturonan acetylesterase
MGSVTAATIYLAGDSTMAPGGGGSGTDGMLLSSVCSKSY